MGTNYYAPGEDVCPSCGRSDEQLHVGKSSSGLAFSFAPYPDRGLTSWKAWRTYLSKVSVRDRITDEYGRAFSLAELVFLVEAKQDQWTHETAPDHAWGSCLRRGSIDSEGYCFSDTADFS